MLDNGCRDHNALDALVSSPDQGRVAERKGLPSARAAVPVKHEAVVAGALEPTPPIDAVSVDFVAWMVAFALVDLDGAVASFEAWQTGAGAVAKQHSTVLAGKRFGGISSLRDCRR